MQSRVLRIGTRGSPLALAQATMVQARLASAHGLPAEAFELKIIRTTGDENLAMIKESIALLAKEGRTAMFDAEHFFDGYESNPDYALRCVDAALAHIALLPAAIRQRAAPRCGSTVVPIAPACAATHRSAPAARAP